MRAVLLISLLALSTSLMLPRVAAAKSTSIPATQEALDASHIGGALLLCGQVTEFTAPDGVATDGAMTMVGVSTPDPHSFVIAAAAALTPGDGALLAAIAATDSFTCLDAVGDGMAIIVELAVLESAQFCGTVDPAGTTWRLTDPGFPELSTTLTAEAEAIVDADVRLDDLLAWFDQFNSEACLTFTTEATGIVSEISLDGELLVCGAVADTSAHPASAVVEYGGPVGDSAIRPDIVGLGGVVLPASLFTDAAIGLLELAYAAQAIPAFDGMADVCARLPVAATELLPAGLEDSAAGVCGWYNVGAVTIGLTDVESTGWSWFALVYDGLSGLTSTPSSDSNLENAMRLGDPTCLQARVDGGAGDEAVEVSASVEACATVVARSSTAITLRAGSATESFELTTGSSVDASLTAGTTGEISLVAYGGDDGPVAIDRTAATCEGGGGGGGLPDTSAPREPDPSAALLALAALGLVGIAAGANRKARRRA